MTYQVLARKWRPRDFASVVGQEPIVTALRNALREGRIANAYLFSGIRGVGKTSVARILAKALNCEKGPENGPCNECETCRSLDTGSNLDILEIDAATHSKVEQVRELTENLKYKPVSGKYKVVVLDEVHRLSRQAFDALLKIIEEPPAHLVFIFATTELESVPATILSRCQEFNFRRVPRQAMVDHLAFLAQQEEITVGDKALRLIARAGEGSVRDAVALLDQLSTFGSGTIADDEAVRILGGVDAALHHKVLAAMIDGDRATLVATVGEVEDRGWDPRHVYAEFLTYARDALHLALGAALDEVELPDDEAAAVAELAQRAGYENLLRLIHQLLASEEGVRRSEAGLLALEIAWLRGAELPRLTRIESLLDGSAPAGQPAPGGDTAPPAATGGSTRSAAPARARASRTAVPQPEVSRTEPPQTEPAQTEAAQTEDFRVESEAPAPEPPPAAPVAPEPEPPLAALAPEPPDAAPEAQDMPPAEPPAPDAELSGVDGFLQLIRQRRQVVAAHLDDVESLAFADGCLTILTTPGDTWLELALRREANRQAFEECLAAAFGPGNRWRVAPAPSGDRATTAVEPPAPEPPDEAAGGAESADSLLDHPRVQAALNVFGGTAETIDDAGS